GVSPEQLLGAIFNLPLGGSGSSSDPLGALSALFGAGTSANKPPGSQSGSAPTPTAGGALSSPLGALGANMIQTQFTQLVDQITKSVREVRLTVSWKEGKNAETLDLVTHVVAMGQGGDRNGNLAAAAQQAAQQAGGGWVNARTGAPVPNPRQGPNGMVDPLTGDPVVPANQLPAGRPLFGGGGTQQTTGQQGTHRAGGPR